MKLLYATLALIVVGFVSTFAHAACVPYDAARDSLLKGYGEVPSFAGELSSGAVLSLFVNPTTGTWTAIVQPNAETACSVASGKGWAAIILPAEPSVDHPAIPHMQEFEDGNGSKYWLVPVRR